MPATSANSRSPRPTGRRLPLTPSVVSSRRGGHLSSPRPVRTQSESQTVASTPAMHITPNVVSAARGGMALNSHTRLTDASKSRALDMRGLRL